MRITVSRPIKQGLRPVSLALAAVCAISLISVFACKAPEPIYLREGSQADFKEAWSKGQQRWSKDQQGGTYFYWRSRHSMAGSIRMTGVQIVDGRPEARYFKKLERDASGLKLTGSWQETRARLNKTGGGYRALSMKELYDACQRKNLGVDLKTHRLQIKIGGQGELLTCHAAHKRCMDDCGENFGVDGIVFRRLSEKDIKKFMTSLGTRWEQ